MKLAEAKALAKQIPADLPSVRVDDWRRYGKESYALECIETRTGVSFVVYGTEDWADRVREAKLYAHD